MGKEAEINVSTSRTGPYYGGDVVKGHVIIDVLKEIRVREITVCCYGYAYVHWTESTGMGKYKTTRSYDAGEWYINQTESLLYPEDRSSYLTLEQSQYRYPYCFQLPADCPASMDTRYGNGSVHYDIKVVIKRYHAFDIGDKFAITVKSHCDLNKLKGIRKGARRENSKTLCCLFCASGPITATLSLDKIGYIPGDIIRVNAEINNGSNREISKTVAKLVQSAMFDTGRKTHFITRTVAKLSKGKVAKGNNCEWVGEELVVPDLPPSWLSGCNIMTVHYYLEFVVHPAGPADNLVLSVNVVIGSIPLRDDPDSNLILSNQRTVTESDIKVMKKEKTQKRSSTPTFPLDLAPFLEKEQGGSRTEIKGDNLIDETKI